MTGRCEEIRGCHGNQKERERVSESGGSFPLDKDTLTAAGAAAEEKHLSETSFRCPFNGHRCHIDSRRRGRKPGDGTGESAAGDSTGEQ